LTKRMLMGAVFVAVAVVAWTGAAAAQDSKALSKKVAGEPTVAEILEKVDGNLTRVKDQTYQAYLEVIRDGKTTKTLKFVAKLKGLQKKLIKFTAPGDVRGMAILTTEEGHMYVYMPSYKRVRRVAAHVRNQGFMGSDISPEEMGAATLSVGWKARMLKKNDKAWVLELKPAAGTETVYDKLIVTVSREHEGVEKIESYDAAGKLVKSQVREDWKRFGPIYIPTRFTITDHRTGSSSVLNFENCTVNEGLSDDAFTKRSLMRGD